MNYTSPHGRVIQFNGSPKIMGIINVTPDSFYPDSRVVGNVENIARKMITDGADILDIGGESTRPGAEPVPIDEELRRVIPAIRTIRKFSEIPISVDTYKSNVAYEAIKAGADIINDISGFNFDKEILNVAIEFNSPYILMHIKGTPKDMQKNPSYDDVVEEIYNYFSHKLEILRLKGVKQIILDPGIGFGKRYEDNLEIIKNIEKFKEFELPILVGHSRKSFIGWLLNKNDPAERLTGTLAVTAYLTLKRVDVIRVHDIKENSEVIRVVNALL